VTSGVQDERAIADLTLPELRLVLAPAIAEAAVFDGWGADALNFAADGLGVDRDVAGLAFKGGAIEMIEAWIETVDRSMAAAHTSEALGALKVRERIRTLVQYRLDQALGLEEAVRRAVPIMALPQNAGRTFRRSWKSADIMWRLAGDTATDYNHYTKRAILASLYAATLAVFVDDRSEGKEETRAFLDRRLADVMRFEKFKARFGGKRPDERFSLARFFGRLRYPDRSA
jgi:ubiquinone biosynthesis protein COQ9